MCIRVYSCVLSVYSCVLECVLSVYSCVLSVYLCVLACIIAVDTFNLLPSENDSLSSTHILIIDLP